MNPHRVVKHPLWQFRVRNSQDIRYVKADTLHEASLKLGAMGFVPEYIQLSGEIVEEKV